MVKKIENRLKTFDTYVSMALGLAIVLIIGALIFNFISKRQGQGGGESAKTAEQQQKETVDGLNIPKTYTVQAGDTLWKISEQVYKSGYNWVDIAKTNNLSNPDDIHLGNVLTIPNVSPKTITTGDISSASTEQKIPASKQYTVQKGDYLWKIAIEQYGNGFRWIDIAKTNNLSNPNLIHPGNVLKLP